MENTTVREIVAQDFRAASVFEKHSIDFCCHGNVTLEEACMKSRTSLDVIQLELAHLPASEKNQEEDYNTWDLDFLTDYIIRTHHSYVKEAIPVISAHCEKVERKHSERHPETKRIHELFQEVAEELTRHMMKEEMVLFPYIKAMVTASQNKTPLQQQHFGSIVNPIRMMEAEHESAGNKLEFIHSTSNGYTLPSDACATFTVTYQELEHFVADLHKHIHLENNILFPKSILLEQQLTRAHQTVGVDP